MTLIVKVLGFLLRLLFGELPKRIIRPSKLHFGRNPIIEEIEEQQREEMKRRIIESAKDGYIRRGEKVNIKDFLNGKKPKFTKVPLEEILKELDEPTISYD